MDSDIYNVNVGTNLNEGTLQNKNYHCYLGTTDILNFNYGSCSVAILHNPKDSEKTIYIENLSISNFSNAPIMVEVLPRGDINGNLKRSTDIEVNNEISFDSKSKAEILYASKVPYAKGKVIYRRSVKSYDTSEIILNGSVILHPGFSRIYILRAIDCCEELSASLSFKWYEK